MYYLKRTLLRTGVIVTILIDLSLSAGLFIAANQNTLIPKLADKVAAIRIPFYLFKSTNVKKLSGINVNEQVFTTQKKQNAIKQVELLNTLAKKYNTAVYGSPKSDNLFADNFNIAYFNNKLKQMYAPDWQTLNTVIPTGIGADKTGKFVVVDYIMQNDTNNLVNYQYKMYLTNNKFSKISYLNKTLNAGGLPAIDNNHQITADSSVIKVNNFFRQLENSSTDKNQYSILLSGYDQATRKIINELIDNHAYQNYVITQYLETDLPDQTTFTIETANKKVATYQITVSNGNIEKIVKA